MAVEITAAMEMAIRGVLQSKLTFGNFRVIPAPIYFKDPADYWKSIKHVSSPPSTQKDVETRHIQFSTISFRAPNDELQNGELVSGHSPLIMIDYEIYIFSQYDLERQDTNATDEELARRVLKHHNEFIEYVLKVKSNFQGSQSMGMADPDGLLVRQQTTSLAVSEEVQDKVECEFIPTVEGHAMKFIETVYIKFKEC